MATAGLFGLGFYVRQRFRLPTTNQGVLVIASLLVPLNFLALAAITRGTPLGDPLLIAGEAASLALFGWLTWLASGTVVATARFVMIAGGLIPSALLLIIGRWAR